MSTKKYYLGILIMLVVVIILILGNILWSSRLPLGKSNGFWSFNQDINLNSPQYGNAGFIIQDPRKVYISQDLKIEENLSYFDEVVLGVFPKSKRADGASGLDYVIGQELLSGLVISSDGWVLLNSLGQESVVDKISRNKSSYVVVSKKDNKIYEIEDFIEGPLIDFSFLKIKNTNSFPVKNFVNINDLRSGQSLLSHNFSGQTSVNFLSFVDSGANPKLSSNFKNSLLLSHPLTTDFKGEFVFNLNGDLLALIDNDLKVWPIHDFRPYIFSFLKNREIIAVDLGVYYVDLKEVVIKDRPAYGALVYNNGLPAVIKGSLAEQIGLREGDVIFKINNYEINNYSNLNDVWNNFVIGDKLVISILRENEIIDLKTEIK
jgi:S1-C subfamily serine protease